MTLKYDSFFHEEGTGVLGFLELAIMLINSEKLIPWLKKDIFLKNLISKSEERTETIFQQWLSKHVTVIHSIKE